MWDPEQECAIQIEMGRGVFEAFTQEDQRGLVDKLVENAPTKGALFSSYIKNLRARLQKEEGLTLPPVYHPVNDALENNEVVIYFGIEGNQFKILDPSEIFDFIAKKIREYNNISSGVQDINHILDYALENVRQDNFQEAYKQYSLAYYHSFLQKYIFEETRCLSDASALLLRSGNVDMAMRLSAKGMELCNNPALIDPATKIQVILNAATVMRVSGRHTIALSFCNTASSVALLSQNYPLLFIALIDLAQIHWELSNYNQAASAFKQADYLLLSNESEPNYELSQNIKKNIIEIQNIIISIQGVKLQELEKKIASEKIKSCIIEIVKTIGVTFAKVAVQSFALKVFGISGTCAISIFGPYVKNVKIFNNSTFTDTQIGDSNIMTIERLVKQ